MAKKAKKAKQAASPSPVAANSGPHLVRDVAMIGQEESNWCWAAVAQSVLALLRDRNSRQQDLVRGHIERSGRSYTCEAPHDGHRDNGTCNSSSCTGGCNDLHRVDIALEQAGISVDELSIDDAPGFADIQAQVRANRPIPCVVRWSSGGGHAVIICGWSVEQGRSQVFVLDPANAAAGQPVTPHKIAHDSLVDNYRQGGRIGEVRFSYSVA
jgi:hypothetical protein